MSLITPQCSQPAAEIPAGNADRPAPPPKDFLIFQAGCLDFLRSLPSNGVDLVLTSPPYPEKGARYIGGERQKLTTERWVGWMLEVVTEAARVSRGYVVVVANNAVRGCRYLPACEGLVWEAHKQGIALERPVIWHKNATPNRRDWFGNDYEFCLVFKPEARNPYFNWEAIAEPAKYNSGGKFRQRSANGRRRVGSDYPQPKLARPRDVWRVTVGGGHMGHPLAHENEAPFPLELAERFIKVLCPPDGLVLDPFCGSGTTFHAAELHRRHWMGCDIRQSQVELATRRMIDVTRKMRCAERQAWMPSFEGA